MITSGFVSIYILIVVTSATFLLMTLIPIKMVQDYRLDLQAIFDAMPGNFIILKPNPPYFTILGISDDLLKITTQVKENVVGKNLFDVFPENKEIKDTNNSHNLITSLNNCLHNKVTEELPVIRYDVANSNGDFEARYWSISNRPVLDEEGNVMYILHSTKEVTEQIKANNTEAELKKLEKTYSIFMQAPVAVSILTGPDNFIELVNQEFLHLIGKTNSIIGKPISDSIPEILNQEFSNLLYSVRKTGESQNLSEYPIIINEAGDEKLRYYNLRLSPFNDNTDIKITTGVFCIAHDVTEQVTARKKLEEERERTRLAIEVGELGVFEINLHTQEIKANNRFDEIFGFEGPKTKSQYESVIHPDDRAIREKQLEAGLKSGLIEYEIRTIHKHNEVRWLKLQGIVLKDETGKPEKAIGVVQDTTKQKTYAEELNKFKIISDYAFDAFILMREDGSFAYLNDLAIKRWGYTREEAMHIRVPDVDPIFNEDVFKESFARAQYENIPTFETLHKRKDGTIYPVEISMGGMTLEGKPHMFAVARDISERKLSENALRDSEARLQAIIDATPECIKIVASDGTLMYMNPSGLDMIEGEASLIGDASVYNVIAPEYRTEWIRNHNRVCKGERLSWEFDIIGLNGTRRRMESHAVPLPGADGNAQIAVTRDITERKKAEEALVRKNAELLLINNDLDNFIYTASHDLKAPIANIEGLLELLSSDFPTLEDNQAKEAKYIMSLMQNAVERFKKTISSLTEVVKLQQENSSEAIFVEFSEILQEVILDLKPMIEAANVDLEISTANCHPIHFSEKNLRSIIYNLLSNAIKYRSPERKPKISITCNTKTDYHVLTVTDNGLGMNLNQNKQLFNMFKRFHDHVEGTGIGLYMVKKIVNNAGGKIEVESQLGEGTTFSIYLPR